MLNNQSDVIFALPKWRTNHWKHIDPEKQILSERSFSNHCLQVPVGGGNDTHINGNGPVVPHPLDHLFLQDPQQLNLDRQGDIPDLIQKQGTLVGRLKPADAVRGCPGIGTFYMAEQFTFQNGLTQRSTVNFNERLVGPVSCFMQRFGHHFLCRYRFLPK